MLSQILKLDIWYSPCLRYRGDVEKLVHSLALDATIRDSLSRAINLPANLKQDEINKIEM